MILHRDYETRSACDLRKCGAHRYAEDPTTDVILAVFIIEDENGKLDEPVVWHPGEPVPEIVKIAAARQWTFAGHNTAFEQAIDRTIMGPRYGFPIVPNALIDCTLARCAIMGLPLALGQACAALKLRYQKDDAGHRLMMKMCKPRAPRKGEDPSKLYWHESPEQIARLAQYCIADVSAEIGLGRALFPISPGEQQVWLLDQRMNNRGVQIDLPFVDVATRVVNGTLERLNKEIAEVSGGAVTAATQVERIKDFCKAHGVALRIDTKTRRNGEEYETETIDKEAIEDLLDGELPATVRRVLEIRLAAGKSSVKKLEKFKLQACNDGRARGPRHPAPQRHPCRHHQARRRMGECRERPCRARRHGNSGACLWEPDRLGFQNAPRHRNRAARPQAHIRRLQQRGSPWMRLERWATGSNRPVCERRQNL
jgi:DNA polymerase bacteriophage-type